MVPSEEPKWGIYITDGGFREACRWSPIASLSVLPSEISLSEKYLFLSSATTTSTIFDRALGVSWGTSLEDGCLWVKVWVVAQMVSVEIYFEQV